VLIRIFLFAALAGAILFAINSGKVFRGMHLLSNCKDVVATDGSGDQWEACTEGRLDGRRDLSDNCAYMTRRDTVDYWRCAPTT
jgi:hypothetical protein